ncbi:MAG: ligase-associated DNA damage response DEXH box helicase [Caulobacteraceae bacterium]
MSEPQATDLPPRFRDWFAGRGWSPRSHQLAMIAKARAGRDALLIAPTGGGKTLAGFLPSLIELANRPPSAEPRGVHTLYISPLKALAVDVHRNLEQPIAEMGLPITVEARTGDTSLAKRERQKLHPPDILITTPEQLALFCAWPGSRAYFKDLGVVILDEIHAMHGSKRGDLLNLALARLQRFAPDMRRVGLSATVNDPDMLRRWLAAQDGSDPQPAPDEAQPARMADLVLGAPGAPPVVDLLITRQTAPWSGWTAKHAIPEVYQAIKDAKTALVFVNTRFQAELSFQMLWEVNEDNLPIALHHGSLAVEQRRKVEAAMARGDLRAVVCTSTLDLGIDWGAVDLVIQLAAPKGSARLIQRIGRANHRLDEPSRALLVPAHRFEMLECQAAREAVAANDLDGDPERIGARDILAQHIMGLACAEPFDLVDLFEELRSSAPYACLSWEAFEQVVDFVATGGYALRSYDRFRRIVKRPDGLYQVRDAQTAQRHRMNVGAIIDTPMLNIRIASTRARKKVGGRKVGEMEESYLEQLAPGDTFLFAGQVWRFEGITGLDALVTPAPPGAEPRVPSWGGSKFALSTYLAARVRRMIAEREHWPVLPRDVQEWMQVQAIRSYIPSADEMLLETFQRGKRCYLVCYPFDGRISHGTLAQLLTRRLERLGKGPLGFVANDYALAIWAMRPMDDLNLDLLFQEDMLGDDLEAWLDESFMMKRTFRNCAMLGGLIERRMPGREKTSRQVTFSTDLIYDVLRRHQPDHLLLKCARADAAAGLLDVARVGRLLARIRGRIVARALPRVSPFAVPVLLEIGRERVSGAADALLEESAEELIAEAMSLDMAGAA